MKEILRRKCIGCNIHKNKKELIRIVKNKNAEINIDNTFRQEGRGAYICNNVKCLDMAIKKKKLEREFKTKIYEEFYMELKQEINCGGENNG